MTRAMPNGSDHPSPVRRWRGRWTPMLAGAALAFLPLTAMAAVVGVLMARALDHEPIPPERRVPDLETVMRAQRKLAPALLALMTSNKPTARLSLSEAEANALLDSALAAAECWPDDDPRKRLVRRFSCRFFEGKAYVAYALELPFWTPFGRYANITARVGVQLRKQVLSLAFDSLAVGSLPIPIERLDEPLDKLGDTPETRLMRSAKSLALDMDGVHLAYDPAAARKVLVELGAPPFPPPASSE